MGGGCSSDQDILLAELPEAEPSSRRDSSGNNNAYQDPEMQAILARNIEQMHREKPDLKPLHSALNLGGVLVSTPPQRGLGRPALSDPARPTLARRWSSDSSGYASMQGPRLFPPGTGPRKRACSLFDVARLHAPHMSARLASSPGGARSGNRSRTYSEDAKLAGAAGSPGPATAAMMTLLPAPSERAAERSAARREGIVTTGRRSAPEIFRRLPPRSQRGEHKLTQAKDNTKGAPPSSTKTSVEFDDS